MRQLYTKMKQVYISNNSCVPEPVNNWSIFWSRKNARQQFNELTCVLHWYKLHNGENDSHKRQFLALRVCYQSWKLNNLSKNISCQIDWCYKLLATIWQKFFLLSKVNCKVFNFINKIADKRGQLALISKCQFDSGNII